MAIYFAPGASRYKQNGARENIFFARLGHDLLLQWQSVTGPVKSVKVT